MFFILDVCGCDCILMLATDDLHKFQGFSSKVKIPMSTWMNIFPK